MTVQEKNKVSDDAQEGRRRFLGQSAIGAAMFAVPGKSVWGACSVSGAQSGNVSSFNRHRCDPPAFVGGRSPGTWKDISTNIHAVFPKSGAKGSPLSDCFVTQINSFIAATTFELDSRLYAGSGSVQTLASALSSNGTPGTSNLPYNLAAVYLNSFYCLYYPSELTENEATRKDRAQQRVTDMLIYIYSEGKHNPAFVLNDSVYNFDIANLSTDFVVNNCDGLSPLKQNPNNNNGGGNNQSKRGGVWG